MPTNKQATLVDFVTDYVDSNFSVRPDMLDSMAIKVKLAVIELQKHNMLPETTMTFESLDLKEEKLDANDKLIFNFYELPADFRELYSNGPGFEVQEKTQIYEYVNYNHFLRNYKTTKRYMFTHQRFNGEYGVRNRIMATPFPADTDTVSITYYVNGVDTKIDDIGEDFYRPVINHVLEQMGMKSKKDFMDDLNTIKRNRQSPAGQGSFHNSFAQTKPRFFGRHRSDTKRRR